MKDTKVNLVLTVIFIVVILLCVIFISLYNRGMCQSGSIVNSVSPIHGTTVSEHAELAAAKFRYSFSREIAVDVFLVKLSDEDEGFAFDDQVLSAIPLPDTESTPNSRLGFKLDSGSSNRAFTFLSH